MNKRIVHDALILTAFTLVLGLVLALVYGVTKAPIEAANQAAAQQAYMAVFEEADSFESIAKTINYFSSTNFALNKAAATAGVQEQGFSDTIDDIQVAKDAAGETLGYVITVTAKDGSQGSITFSVGIQNDGTVNGYSITATSETPGLGLKASEEEFYGQFQGKNVDAFTVVKQAPQSDNEIEAISGSTITSKAMANGCNAAIYYFQNQLVGGAQ